MILAEKIADLRKKNGWSQEELSNRLGVSRQAVSKWESAASIPDLDKIIKMSDLFGVSTDYLLKDSLGENKEDEIAEEKRVFHDTQEEVRTVTVEEANEYLNLLKNTASRIAMGVSLCILSPVVLIGLLGITDSERGFIFSEAAMVGIGLTVLLVMIAAAVAVFLIYGRKLEAYEYLEHEPLELAYGVKGMVEKEKYKYEGMHSRNLVLGIVLCILSAIPVITLTVADEIGMITVLGVNLCLILVAAGVFLIVSTMMIYGGFQKLLEEGDYTRKQKLENKKTDRLNKIYWCTVTAIYLCWSFITNDWGKTWIIWPVAGVLYGAVAGLGAMIR